MDPSAPTLTTVPISPLSGPATTRTRSPTAAAAAAAPPAAAAPGRSDTISAPGGRSHAATQRMATSTLPRLGRPSSAFTRPAARAASSSPPSEGGMMSGTSGHTAGPSRAAAPPHARSPAGSPSGGGGSSCTRAASSSACVAVQSVSSSEVACSTDWRCVAFIHALRAAGSISCEMRAAPCRTASAESSSTTHSSSSGQSRESTSGLNGRLDCVLRAPSDSHLGSSPPSFRRSVPRTTPRRTRSAASSAAIANVSKPLPSSSRRRESMILRSRPMSPSEIAAPAWSRRESGTSKRVSPALTASAVTSVRRRASAGTTSTRSMSTPDSSSQIVSRRERHSASPRSVGGAAVHSGAGSGRLGCSTVVTRASSAASSSLNESPNS
mmetsp:Transcript_11574/g.30740  ORF Transcript_11574/g.30740 Transcript_11574/m.30740 type:complete len:382 (+) Transcript_11574:545-1690(+)